MTKKQTLILFLIAISVAIAVASLLGAPGYMDAEYYFSGGLRLAEGKGFTEMILWNYLDDPQGIPHPSHTYWMPLTSIIAYIGILIAPFFSKFKAAQLGFILISAVIPLITAQLAYQLFQDKNKGFFAGMLAIFSGFYLSFITTTDAFSPYILLGGLFFLLLLRMDKIWHYLAIGLIAGLMHMARADGLIWLLVAFSVVWLNRKKVNVIKYSFYVLLGYLAISFPWLWRNWQLSGSLLAQGGSRALFMLGYNDLYNYPANSLNLDYFISVGFWEILKDRGSAIFSNLQTGFAVQGLIFLGPLALISAWRKRKELSLQTGWIAWGLTFFVMSILFPFSGARGGFFHSGAAFMPIIWALSTDGLDRFISWIGEKRNWNIDQAKKFFQNGTILIVFIISFFMVFQKVPSWTMNTNSHQIIEANLVKLGAMEDDIVLVNNPPSYFATTNRSAIVIPNGGTEVLLEVIAKYEPSYLVLELNHPEGLSSLYEDPQSFPGLEYLETVWDQALRLIGNYEGTHIFKVGTK